MDVVALEPGKDPRMLSAALQGAVTRTGQLYWSLTEFVDAIVDAANLALAKPELNAVGVSNTDLSLDAIALTWRESNAGEQLRPRGVAGSGDWTARHGHWVGSPHTQVITSPDDLPHGWDRAQVKQTVAPFLLVDAPLPWCIMADGKGFGRYAMQLDGPQEWDWLQAHPDPMDHFIRGVELHAANLQAVRGWCGACPPGSVDLTEEHIRIAAMDAYNEGLTEVVQLLSRARNPDDLTTGRNYGTWTWAIRQRFAGNFVKLPGADATAG